MNYHHGQDIPEGAWVLNTWWRKVVYALGWVLTASIAAGSVQLILGGLTRGV